MLRTDRQTIGKWFRAVALAALMVPALAGAQMTAPAGAPHAVLPPAHNFYSPYMAWMNFQWMTQMSRHFLGPMVDEATRFEVLNAMMRAADPRLMFGGHIPGLPTQTLQQRRPNTVSGDISIEAKRNFYQSMMMMSPLSMRDMIAIMAEKMPVADDITFEDAVDAMKLRANEVNFKLVGHSPLWLDVRAISGDEDTPRVEIFQFCDAMVARKILDYSPEFVVFLPCRIALLEDADGKLWVMTLDWDVNWVDFAQNPNSVLDEELREEAKRIRSAMRYIMEGAATGDF